jgi:hypothetical protein
MDEGTDWRPCSDVYTTGIPGSIGFDIQLCSRGGRGKGCIAGYPEHSENTQRMFYFLPKLDEESRARVMVAYSDLMIAKSLILQSLEAGLEVVNTSASVKLTSRTRTAKEEDAFIDHEVTLAEHADAWHGDLVQNSAAFAKVVKTLARMGDGVTLAQVGEVVENASKGLDEEQRAALMRGAIEHVRVWNPELAKAWAGRERASQYKSASGGYRPASIIRADMIEEWRAFVVAHGEKVCPRLDKVLERAAGFNGSTCEEMVGSWANRGDVETNAREIVVFHATHGFWPRQASGGNEEARLGMALKTLRKRHHEVCERYGIPLRSRPEDYQDLIALDIIAFHSAHGFWPRTCADDHAEKRLGKALNKLRCNHLDVCAHHGIPLKGSPSDAMRRARGKEQFPTLGLLTARFARQFRPTLSTPDIEGDSGIALSKTLGYAHLEPSRSRGLGYAIDLCQVNSLARANAEIEHDCWRFTLKGTKKPDPRPWSVILASRDNKRIETAERIAFLDWESLGGEVALGVSNSRGYVCSRATRRPWSPPATQPEAGKPAPANGKGKRASAKA